MSTTASAPEKTYTNAQPQKHIGTAYKWLYFLGVFGAHRYYMGKIGTGLLYTFTGGLVGIGVLVDVFTVDGQVIAVNEKNSVTPTLR